MTRVPLTNIDTAWLRMEHPTNLMMIAGVMVFSTPIDLDRLSSVINERLLRFDRFRQRVVQPGGLLGQAFWEDDPDFDLANHVQAALLPPPGDEAALSDLVSSLMSTQLDFSRPLWRMDVVEQYGEGSAIIARLHHCIADGIALVQVLLSLADNGSGVPVTPTARQATQRSGSELEQTGFEAFLAVGKATVEVTERAVSGALNHLADPVSLLDVARQGASAGAALARLALRWPDPKTMFKGPLAKEKRAAWSQPIPLDDVKAVGRWFKGTVNDVLLSTVAGALRSYLQQSSQQVDGVTVRAVVPVNLRPPGAELELGNRFSLVFLALPVGIADPIERLAELKRTMDELKGSQEPGVAFAILNTLGMVPGQIQDVVVDIFGTKGTAVMTNVPGPRSTISIAGAPVSMLMAWVPQSGKMGMGVSIVSYDGQVRLGVATDQGLVPDPEAIVDAFSTEFDKLLDLVRQRYRPKAKTLLETMDRVNDSLDALLRSLEDEQ